MKKIKTEYIFIGSLILGLILLTYPSLSNWVNSLNSSRVIMYYSEALKDMGEDLTNLEFEKALEYNAKYANSFGNPDDTRLEEYNSLLNVMNDGVMGYIEIPKIAVKLPIYHGTEESVLSTGVGHIEWSSLPVGGQGSHCIMSGHRGLPSAKLFSDLDMLEVNDYFMIEVMGSTLTYQISQINVIIPEDIDLLKNIVGEDVCTLVTCTPYGINTHRLLITGNRVENIKNYNVVSDATKIDSKLVAFFIAFPVLVILFIIVMLKKEKK